MEGFPRSGNTFLLYLYRHWNKDGNVCHHTHFPSQVIRAVRLRKPCIVTIRMPQDAVTSLLIRHPELSIDLALWNYISFYQSILPIVDKIVVATYEQIMENPAQIFAEANKKYGCKIEYGMYNAELREHFLNKLYSRNKKASKSSTVRPNCDMAASKIAIKKSVMANKKFSLAESVYSELINSQVHRQLG